MSTNVKQTNEVITRRHLDIWEMRGINEQITFQESKNLAFVKINGVADFWSMDLGINLHNIMTDILASQTIAGSTFVFTIRGDKHGISLYVGTNKELIDTLMYTYCSMYPGIDLQIVETLGEKVFNQIGGFITGYPAMDNATGFTNQLENICRGMLGKEFTYQIVAKRVSSIFAQQSSEKILEEMKEMNEMVTTSITGVGYTGNVSMMSKDFIVEEYISHLEQLLSIMQEACQSGLWYVSSYYGATNNSDAEQMKAVVKTSLSGQIPVLEPVRCMSYIGNMAEIINECAMVTQLDDKAEQHVISKWQVPGMMKALEVYKYKYQTLMSSHQLAKLTTLPGKEFPGYYKDEYVEFDTAIRRQQEGVQLSIGEIALAGRNVRLTYDAPYTIDLEDLTRHALVIGMTGGGKTNTSKSILTTLWQTHKKPFLVIESAKREYWELMNNEGFEDLLVFTLGLETKGNSVPFRFNPFEVIGSVALQTHIDYLLATFNASFDLQAPMPYVLETAVYSVYADKGWDIIDNSNKFGYKIYPTLKDLYEKIEEVVDNLNYHQEIQSNLKAALKARIQSLRIGGKGAMMDVEKSMPIDYLLNKPTVLELEDIGDDDTKAFVIGIFLVQLYEYRKSNMEGNKKNLQHVLLVEEAHRLLKNVTGESNPSRAKAVEFFCNMLAEIRSFGQGIMIADQVPTKLAADTLKNTNLKIIHRTVMKEDREAVGYAMNMTDDQMGYLSSLRRGIAAVYAEGDNKPKLVKMPLVTTKYNWTRKQVIERIHNQGYRVLIPYLTNENKHNICSICQQKCLYGKVNEQLIGRIGVSKIKESVISELNRYQYEPKAIQSLIEEIYKYYGNEQEKQSYEKDLCLLGYIFEQSSLAKGKQLLYLLQYEKYLKLE